MSIIFLDGQYVKVSHQILETFTPGMFNAKGVFETMLGLDGVVIDDQLHLKRLRKGLKVLGIKPIKMSTLILEEVLQRNHLSLGRVRLLVWKAGANVHVMVAALPYKMINKKSYRVCLIKTNRKTNAQLSTVKSLDYGLFSNAFTLAKSQGFDEALLLNSRGHIFEASRANIFWMKTNILYTPPLSSGCLNGITRQQVIGHARKFKIPVKEENLTLRILKEADAAFLTNSLIGVKIIEDFQQVRKI